ncbi:MAG: TrkA family potassium uptake protein [Clostridia bacterium]|nr:TrkA family potassium uptake protein [Clostridia bacterium]
MRINESYAVFGLGRYGVAVAKELSDSGADVIAVDIDEELVSEASAVLPICRCADITDPDVIKQLGISNVDTVIIAMANSLEASVMAITLCKEAGVKTVIAKCANEMHQKILLRVGADKVVFPEKESGIRLAKNLLSSDFIDVIELSSNVSMIELNVKREWEGKSLIELNLRRKYSINVVAVRKKGEVKIDIDPATPLTADMKLIVIASGEKLRKLL